MQGKLEITFCLIQTMAPVAFYESGGSWWPPVAPGIPPGGIPVAPRCCPVDPGGPRWPPGGPPVDPRWTPVYSFVTLWVTLAPILGPLGSTFGPRF